MKQAVVKEVEQKTKPPRREQTTSSTDASIDRLADTIQKASVNIQPVGLRSKYIFITYSH